MEIKNFIDQFKSEYATLQLYCGETDRAREISESEVYTPVFKVREAHPEAEPSAKDYNEMVCEAYNDINALKIAIKQTAQNYNRLMIKTETMLQSIKNDLLQEKEKQQDLNMLCNCYTDFDNVISIDPATLRGSFSHEDGVITAKQKSYVPVSFSIEQITGNGYEGNEFVYENDKFVSESLDTSNRDALNDNNKLTVYEYSRITCSNSETNIFEYVNKDSIEAKCHIVVKGNSVFNKLNVSVSSKDTAITDIAVSDDGATFTSVLSKPIYPNDSGTKYQNINAIPESGIRSFPSSKYMRITLESNGVTNDKIAFIKTTIAEKSNNAKMRSANNDLVSSSVDIPGSILVRTNSSSKGTCPYCGEAYSEDHSCRLMYDIITNKIITRKV